ncbi:MAG: E3 binding domain-containing protein, partial [Cyclobacteriaceae bacterium]|nr:E3 binding domain-containing protein [Cyclobacteriaceae bacterium]
MAEIIRMPKMSDTMTEGVIAKWHKKVGDTVKSGELMAEIETDKATMDYESFNTGTVLYIGAKEGEPVKVNDVLAIVGKQGEDYKALLDSAAQAAGSGGSQSEAPQAEASAPAKAIDTSGIKAEIVLMPKMSDTMTEGVIAAWHKKVGDPVKSGELLAEVETDKATMEYESYNTGTLLYVGAEAGKPVAINAVLAIIGDKDADWKTLLEAHQAKAGSTAAAPAEKPAAPAQAAAVRSAAAAVPAAATTGNGRIKASPLAKKLAKERGLDLRTVPGTGDQGRITKR